jgi:trk system potassium uptake protein TrkA
MYVVIAGGGVLGGSLARSLVEGRHDVVVIERDQEICQSVSSRIGALVINGSATDIEVLEEAGIEKADVAVGALPTDADNLSFIVLARNFDVPRILARMRAPRYEAAYRLAGASRCINVGGFFVNQLVLEIEQPTLHQVAAFGEGKASIVVAAVPEGSLAHGKMVQEIAADAGFPRECVIAGIYRREEDEEDFIFPRGGIEIHEGDQVFLASNSENVRKAAEYLQRTKKKRGE